MGSGRDLLDRLLGRGPGAARRALALGVAALLASAALAWVAWGGAGGAGEGEGDDAAAAGAGAVPVPAVEVVDRRDGVALLVPAADEVDRTGGAVRVVRADGAVTLTIDALGPGPVDRAHADVLDAVEASYPQVRLEPAVAAELDGRDGLRSVGTVRRDDGTELVAQLTTVAGAGRAWGVAVFADAEADPGELAAWLRAVLRSVRLGR